ncbi:17S U2 SnRNP complex component HTATSF1 isoform X1 [Ciona intestinalis]
MSMKKEDYEEFQRQLELQNQLPEQDAKVKTKKDEDGTEYEWDEVKKAWFPKLSPDLMLKFQSNYSNDQVSSSTSVYVDPQTKMKYKWDNAAHKWLPDVKYEVSKDGNYIYTDPSNGDKYEWESNKQVWVKKNFKENNLEDDNIIHSSEASTNPEDESWNSEKKLWGEVPNEKQAKKKNPQKSGQKRAASRPEWFSLDKSKNTSVYIEGLPNDITMDEFRELMLKCGIIATNVVNQQPKLKLYTNAGGKIKGDGLCCYLKRESVELSLQLLDGMEVKGHKLKVQEAKFELKGEYDASKKPKMLSKKEKRKIKKEKEKLLDWKLARSEEIVSKKDRVVILKKMFQVNEFEEDPVLITDVRDDLRVECEKFGQVKKVIVFDRHPDGVCSVAFKEAESATKCQRALNGRWFACKVIEASIWDGHTDYQIEETDREREVRLQKWEEFLDSGPTEQTSGNNDDVGGDTNVAAPAEKL